MIFRARHTGSDVPESRDNNIMKSSDTEEYTLVILMSLSKAFDAIGLNILFRNLFNGGYSTFTL